MSKIVNVFTILLFILLIVLIVEMVTMEEIRTKEVKCFDQFGNEFNDEYCTEEIMCGIIYKKLNPSYCYG